MEQDVPKKWTEFQKNSGLCENLAMSIQQEVLETFCEGTFGFAACVFIQGSGYNEKIVIVSSGMFFKVQRVSKGYHPPNPRETFSHIKVPYIFPTKQIEMSGGQGHQPGAASPGRRVVCLADLDAVIWGITPGDQPLDTEEEDAESQEPAGSLSRTQDPRGIPQSSSAVSSEAGERSTSKAPGPARRTTLPATGIRTRASRHTRNLNDYHRRLLQLLEQQLHIQEHWVRVLKNLRSLPRAARGGGPPGLVQRSWTSSRFGGRPPTSTISALATGTRPSTAAWLTAWPPEATCGPGSWSAAKLRTCSRPTPGPSIQGPTQRQAPIMRPWTASASHDLQT
ncbi:uncharacterized protein LOC142830834 [Pelodiscus sinensis]|uniref:uncharacterized protein LOC142830834 n=1 Tax=Pelodiscus sinensis TaxID=13735 RepID=UPI003F6B3A4A